MQISEYADNQSLTTIPSNSIATLLTLALQGSKEKTLSPGVRTSSGLQSGVCALQSGVCEICTCPCCLVGFLSESVVTSTLSGEAKTRPSNATLKMKTGLFGFQKPVSGKTGEFS